MRIGQISASQHVMSDIFRAQRISIDMGLSAVALQSTFNECTSSLKIKPNIIMISPDEVIRMLQIKRMYIRGCSLNLPFIIMKNFQAGEWCLGEIRNIEQLYGSACGI